MSVTKRELTNNVAFLCGSAGIFCGNLGILLIISLRIELEGGNPKSLHLKFMGSSDGILKNNALLKFDKTYATLLKNVFLSQTKL